MNQHYFSPYCQYFVRPCFFIFDAVLLLPIRRTKVPHSGTARLPWRWMRRSTRAACTSVPPEMMGRATASSRYDKATSVGASLVLGPAERCIWSCADTKLHVWPGCVCRACKLALRCLI